MEVQINGTTERLPEGISLAQLLVHLDLHARRLAIEHNLDVVPRSQYGAVRLQQGDRLEIVHAIGGG
ncbi:sulfur carrier protein ThiS [Pseudomonas benzenivorans]|uniref:Sulfur carrier protein ThiS n=1 Tax=Pseudomonas benzenivorans TaxID=556533 RepID=A0ABZ0Q3F9_9PSED|nr:sulfur carrier protein ThiS [Pseudomonas benzenivorans]WPC07179.1 sulfur carrier protein ThiS [Pseudomonas benzenivorans]